MVDRLGPDPWLGRLVEIADEILAAAADPHPRPRAAAGRLHRGQRRRAPVPGAAYLGDRRPQYLEAANQIGRAYLQSAADHHLLATVNRWDFVKNEPLDRRRFRLSDHGNEILPGLLEWHFAATLSGDPDAPARPRHDPTDARSPRRPRPQPGRALDARHRDPLRQGRAGGLLRQLGLRLRRRS